MVKVILFLLITTLSAYSPFCNGFKAGYKAGYCYNKSYCIEPISPICPIPGIGERTWIDGYNRGFLKGLSK